MKRLLFINTYILLLIICINSIKAQPKMFAPVGAEWHYTVVQFECRPIENEYIRFWVSKDTLVDGKVCSFIENDSKRVVDLHSSCYSTVIVPSYIMYEENQKVYKWYKNKFYLVFDFDVSLQDTLRLYVQPAWIESDQLYPLPDEMYPFWGTVTNIDSIRVDDNHYLNRINVETLGSEINSWGDLEGISYIERMGNFYDYIVRRTTPRGFPPMISYSQAVIRCYKDDEVSYTRSDWQKRCDWSIGINTLKEKEFQVNIYPNPANDFITIEFTEDIPITNTVVSIENVWGKNYLKQKITGKQTRLDISMLPVGIYITKIQTADNQFKITKMIKL